jgi:RNA polymerase subunit RPABC4/transcription elongation factor Spt4
MKKKECPSCAMEVDAKSKSCPVCNYEFTGSNQPVLKWIALLLVILFFLSLFMF